MVSFKVPERHAVQADAGYIRRPVFLCKAEEAVAVLKIHRFVTEDRSEQAKSRLPGA
jgi:hypothetical protein